MPSRGRGGRGQVASRPPLWPSTPCWLAPRTTTTHAVPCGAWANLGRLDVPRARGPPAVGRRCARGLRAGSGGRSGTRSVEVVARRGSAAPPVRPQVPRGAQRPESPTPVEARQGVPRRRDVPRGWPRYRPARRYPGQQRSRVRLASWARGRTVGSARARRSTRAWGGCAVAAPAWCRQGGARLGRNSGGGPTSVHRPRPGTARRAATQARVRDRPARAHGRSPAGATAAEAGRDLRRLAVTRHRDGPSHPLDCASRGTSLRTIGTFPLPLYSRGSLHRQRAGVRQAADRRRAEPTAAPPPCVSCGRAPSGRGYPGGYPGNEKALRFGGPFHATYIGRAGDGGRTRDIQLGKLALCQLSYARERRTIPARPGARQARVSRPSNATPKTNPAPPARTG